MKALPSGLSYLRWNLLALLFVLAAMMSKGRACPRSCACYVPTEVHCTFRYLTAIPREIQPVVERINLGYNSLAVLRENDFTGLENLELLMLHSNTISNIEDRAFNDLKSLQVLKMSYNKVKEINKDTFSGLHSLVRLHIDHNQIEFINPETFYGLTNLQLVHLEGNLLQQLHPDTFITLRHSQVFKLSSVKSIYLSDNALTSIPADLFAGCYQLENVYLHGNPWSCDCHMDWLTEWAEKNPGVLKCKRDKKASHSPACPVCESPVTARGRGLTQLARDDFTCTKSWIHPYLKQRNFTLDEDDFTPVSAKDFIAPIGTLQMNVTDEVHNDATLACVVQRPSGVENLNLTQMGDDEDVTVLRATISTSLVCNIDYDQIQQLWRVLAMYSDTPMRLERGLLLSMSPEMTYKYRQARLPDEEIYTEVEADIKANPAWLLQGQISLQLDRTTTTFSTLHIRYSSSVQLRVDSRNLRRDRYSWSMIKQDNQTKTEHAVVTGSTAVLNCETFGNPKPSMEWILADGSKVRAPYQSDDQRITISDSGKLTLRSVDKSDAGIYRCIATNYLDADVLIFRITVLSPDVEETEVNGVQMTRSLGQSLLLDCGSTGNPRASIQWVLPDHSVLDQTNGNRHVYINGSLGIQSLTERDRGFYRCLSSNYLGVDLLTSQVSIADEGTKQVQIIDSEGSGLNEIDADSEETETTHSGLIYSKSSQRTNQESRTITSDRPYPRNKPPPTRGGHRRGNPLSNRRKWGSRRVFDKGSRRVDPQKFAEFMKKAQSGQTTNNEIGKADQEHGNTKTDLGLSGDGDLGSGEGFSEDQIVAMPNGVVTITEMPETNQYDEVTTKGSEDSQDSAMTTTDTYVHLYDNQDGHMTTTESLDKYERAVMSTTEILDDNQDGVLSTTESIDNIWSEVVTRTESSDDSQDYEMTTTENPVDSVTSAITTAETRDKLTPGPHHRSDISPVLFPALGVTTSSYDIQRDETTPFENKHTYSRGFSDNRRYTFQTRPKDSFKRPVTLKLTVTESTDEMQLMFSGDTPESSTEGMSIVNSQNPNVTPMMDGLAPRLKPVVHTSTDPDSQTTFTAVTTTEREQDEITFHTTQRIKSHRLPAGSTIISRQQIEIIPPHRRRPGRRRNFPNRRRIIRPNKITDIQSYLDKLKKPSVSQKGAATVPYSVELSTDCGDCDDTAGRKNTAEESNTNIHSSSPQRTEKPIRANTFTRSPEQYPEKITQTFTSGPVTLHVRTEGANSYMTSADAPDLEPTQDPVAYQPTTTKATTTTKSSKVIRGKIPWHKLFGTKEGQKELLNRLRKPVKPATTTTTTTVTTTTTTTPTTTSAIPTTTEAEMETTFLPTVESLVAPVTLPPAMSEKDLETSGYDSEDSFSTITKEESTTATQAPTTQETTTTAPTYGSRFPSTTDSSSSAKTLDVPPTMKPIEEAVESSFSGSDSWGSGTWTPRRVGGQNRRFRGRGRFRGRRPMRKPTTKTPTTTTTTTMATTTTTTEVPTTTTELPETSTLMETTTLVPRPVSKSHSGGVSRPLYTHFWEKEIAVVSSPSGTMDSYGVEWRIPSYFTTNRPREYTTSRPTTPSRTTPSSRLYGTPRSRVQTSRDNRMYTNGRVPPGRYGHSPTHRPPVRPVRPTMPVITEGSKRRTDTERTLTSVRTTDLPTKPEYTNRPSLYDYDDVDNTYDHQAKEYDTTTSIITEPSTEDMPAKPRIVGGNAASFTVLSNSDAVLPCEADGNPTPTISWRRFLTSTGTTLTVRGKMGKFEVLQNGTLYIQDVNIKDRGQYVCLAENDYGSDKLIVTLSVVAYPSRILEPKVRDIKVHSGNTVEMNCKTEGRPTPLVSWILANRTQVRGQDTDHGRVSVTPEGTLVLRHVSVYDRGHYKCIASNAAGVDTATVRLQVIAAPPDILEEKRQQLSVRSGDDLWLPCTAKGTPQPTVHWVLPAGSVVHPQRYADRRSSAFANGTLHLKSVTTADSGVFECIANSPAGSERRVVTLTVEATQTPPQIVEVSQRRTDLEFGDQLQLNCSASGDPKPRIVWRLPSKAVVDRWHRMGSRLQVLENGTLIIDSVSEKDAGDYICVARNDLGDDLQLLKVGVSMKPAKIETKAYGKKQVPYGKDLQVDCKASGAPMPEISWGLPDGTVVNSALQADGTSRGRSRRFILFDNGTLYLNRVGMAEEGDYTCYAENTVGKDEMHVHITVVTAAPRIRAPSATYARVAPGGNVRFDCEAVGEPKPKILWMLPSNDMIAASNERYLMHVNGSLDIRDVKLVDAGEYVCMARNTAGDDSKVYKLDIDGNPPVINGYYQNRTVIKETAAKYSRKFIDCKAVGDPPPHITWIMPDNIFLKAPYYGSRINVHHNGTLEIRNVRPTDSAEFICMARNDGGEAVMVVQLEVTTMLRRPIFKNPFNERVVTHMGKTTVLNCSADGHPRPDITWMLPNGTRLSAESERGSQHHLSGDGTFVIYNPGKVDAGKYRCAAKNSVGYIEKLIVLEVGQKPYILTRPRGVIRSVAGDPLYLHCLADGSPRPGVSWTLPGGLVLTQPQSTGRYRLMENGTLLIRDTVLHDRGSYHCRARNSAGDALLTVPVVIVAFPPRITTGPPATIRAVSGVPLKLNCLATGLPTPEITWELPDRSVLSTAAKGRPSGSELLHPQGTLVIQKPTNADSGAYKCFAKNHLGTDTRITYVRVI
ncbi:immunoglobulin superfamily member 10 isoform X2 [Alosa sapidissima]|uniref:immunoglobulin superfamily member 10 isoform X2 n=1 Tax=Alosa sapidissima TaxID=34773 RepID=UPI001C08EB06|nr:immunoglobulin superfamily member 10 isoform X2 [Alosa sapidissima]